MANARQRKNTNTPPLDGEMLTKEDVKKLLKISLTTVNNYIDQGILIAYGIGGNIRLEKSEVLGALQKIDK